MLGVAGSVSSTDCDFVCSPFQSSSWCLYSYLYHQCAFSFTCSLLYLHTYILHSLTLLNKYQTFSIQRNWLDDVQLYFYFFFFRLPALVLTFAIQSLCLYLCLCLCLCLYLCLPLLFKAGSSLPCQLARLLLGDKDRVLRLHARVHPTAFRARAQEQTFVTHTFSVLRRLGPKCLSG